MGLFNKKKKAAEAEAEVQNQIPETAVLEEIPGTTVQDEISEICVPEENGNDETMPTAEYPQENGGLTGEQVQILDANESKINRALAEIGRIFVERYMDDVPDEEIAEQYAVIQQCAEENNAILTSVMPEVTEAEEEAVFEEVETEETDSETMYEETVVAEEEAADSEETEAEEAPEAEEVSEAEADSAEAEAEEVPEAEEVSEAEADSEETEAEEAPEAEEVSEAAADSEKAETEDEASAEPEADENDEDTTPEEIADDTSVITASIRDTEVLDFDAMDDAEFVSSDDEVVADEETAEAAGSEDLGEQLVKCPACGEMVPDDYYCDMCGEQLKELPEEEKPKVMYCSNCGGELLIGQPTCKKCGCDIIWGDEE